MFLKKVATKSSMQMVKASLVKQPAILAMPVRNFGITKYAFDDEDWKPNQFQVSDSHESTLQTEC
jgi:hypothetical protein